MWVCRYDEIQSIQVNYLLSVWLSGGEEESKELHKKLDGKIDSYAAGELEHAVGAISSIWDLARKDGALPFVPKRHEDPHPPGPAGWGMGIRAPLSMRTPLIKSMRGGSLLHRKYWARRSRGGTMGFVYLPATVSGPTLVQVDTLLEYCEGADGRLKKKEECPEDSDCESECEGDGDPVPGDADVGCERGKELLPVLKIGSLIAWRSLILYLCTDKITFAPLKSQGSVYRSEWKQKNTKPGSPVPCSPKTTYTLAKKLNITRLVTLALKDIEAKITNENAMTETFSRFASQYSEIMVMGWKHLDAQLKAKNVNTPIRETIQGMAGGRAAHQADALKFGLYGALRQKGPANRSFARLRCPDATCEARRQPVSYLSLGNNLTCTKHKGWGGWFGAVSTKVMECSECGHTRTDHCTWCKGCRRIFG